MKAIEEKAEGTGVLMTPVLLTTILVFEPDVNFRA